jgi:pimeloyl-ACP methyl ester carboxylesterase
LYFRVPLAKIAPLIRAGATLIAKSLPGALAVLFASLLPVEGSAQLEFADCRIHAGPGYPGIKARCADFERPLDPSDANSPAISLFVAVIPALTLEPQPDPFVPIAGGPGQASTGFYAAQAHAFEFIRRNRDIVLVDQRGTGKSTPLTCDVEDDVLEGDVSLEETVAAAKQCLAALPHDPRFFTTSVAVADLEALRQAQGYPALNVYGVSYGTRVAQHYLRRHPDVTRTLILDGVVPPQVALGPTIALEAQRALDAIFARCASNTMCGERFPEIAAQFKRLKARLLESPQTVEVPDPVTGHAESLRFGPAELAGALRLLSYHPNTVALIPLLVDEAAAGNYGPLASQYLMVVRSLSDALSIGMHNAVVCTEDAPLFEPGAIDRAALEATYMGPVQLDAIEAICSAWPAGILDEGLHEALQTAVPVLLLSGDADPVTPPAFADMAAVGMTNSKHLVGVDQGHGQAPRPCIPDIMADFVARASVDDLDEECLAERQFAMPFFLDFTGPSP